MVELAPAGHLAAVQHAVTTRLQEQAQDPRRAALAALSLAPHALGRTPAPVPQRVGPGDDVCGLLPHRHAHRPGSDDPGGRGEAAADLEATASALRPQLFMDGLRGPADERRVVGYVDRLTNHF